MWEDENDASRDGGLGNPPQLGSRPGNGCVAYLGFDNRILQ